MPKLEDYKNFHKDKDIYILASGKSVDFIDKSFFKNKIVIGVNQVYKKVECQYLLRKESQLIKEVLEKNPNTIHFISKGNCGGDNNTNVEYIINNVNDTSNIVLYNHNINKSKEINILLPKDNSLVVSASTITTAIHLACYMGAKNILLVGHDGGMINGECNFTGYHTDETYKIAWSNGVKDYKIWVSNVDKQTISVKKELEKKYNCNIYSINPFINFNLDGNKYTKI